MVLDVLDRAVVGELVQQLLDVLFCCAHSAFQHKDSTWASRSFAKNAQDFGRRPRFAHARKEGELSPARLFTARMIPRLVGEGVYALGEVLIVQQVCPRESAFAKAEKKTDVATL